MAENKEPQVKSNELDAVAIAVGSAAVAVILTAPAAIIAGVAHHFYPNMRRSERVVVIIGALAAIVLAPKIVIVDPIRWAGGIVGLGHTGIWPVPFLGILVMAGFYLAILDSLFATKIGGRFRMSIKDRMTGNRNPFARKSLIPEDNERNRMNIAPVPGGNIGGHHLQHSMVGAVAPVGKRQIAFALDRTGTPVMLSEHEMGMHGAILGSTGSGKTVTIEALGASLMDLGWSGLILDLKEDLAPGGLRDFCTTYAAHHSIPFQQMGLSDPNSTSWFNPLSGMDPDYARDTILSLTEFDDAYWQNINKKMLGQLVNLCFDAHQVDPINVAYPTINGLGRILEAGNLKAATRKMMAIAVAGGIEASRYSALSDPDPDAQKSASGFGAKLTQMYDTIAGRTVLAAGVAPSGALRTEIDVTAPGLTYIGLDSTGKPDLAKLISSAVLQRMSVYAAQRTTGILEKGHPRFLIIDEASVVDRSLLQALLSKARGAGVCVIVCTQGPDDWIDKHGDDWSMLIQNINFGIIMSQGSPRAAELCADFIGSEHQYSLNQRVGDEVDGVAGSVTQKVDYVVQPHEIRQLKIGEAILRVGKPTERVTWIGIQQRDPTAL